MAETVRQGSVMSETAASVAGVYAEALLGTLPDDATAASICDELTDLAEVLDQAPGWDALVTHVVVRPDEKRELIERLFRGRVSEPVEAFLSVLARRGRLRLLPAAARQFRRLLNSRQGKVEVMLTSAVPLDVARQEAIAKELGRALAAETVLTTRVDPKLLGGMTVRVGDCLYDSSVATALDRLEKGLGRRLAGRI